MIRIAGPVAEDAIDVNRACRAHAQDRQDHVEELRILVLECRILRGGSIAFLGAAPVKMRVAILRRNAEAAHRRKCRDQGGIDVERQRGACPSCVHPGVEIVDLRRAIRNEIVIEP